MNFALAERPNAGDGAEKGRLADARGADDQGGLLRHEDQIADARQLGPVGQVDGKVGNGDFGSGRRRGANARSLRSQRERAGERRVERGQRSRVDLKSARPTY